MRTNRTYAPRRRNGVVCALALSLLVITGLLAAAFVSGVGLNLRAGANERLALNSRLAAESGISFMLFQLGQISLPGDTTPAELPGAIAAALAFSLNDSGNLGGQTVDEWQGVVTVPKIQLDAGSFTSSITVDNEGKCNMIVTGNTDGVTRRLQISLLLRSANSSVFDYGLASKGSISILGNSQIVGIDDPTEASILSASTTGMTTIAGHALVSGDIYTAAGLSGVAISGSPSVAGEISVSDIMQHIHTGVTPPLFPQADTEPLAPLATNVVNSQTEINENGLVLTNIRIAAGTNPNFGHDVVLNGIVVVEAPNNVKFDGKVTVNGMIITVGSQGNPITNCQIRFAGQVEANGVEALPDLPEFEAIKQQTGTFILAPGFDVRFEGQFSVIGGTIAADQLTFSGQAEGTVSGSVIGLADYPTVVDGNVAINVRQVDTDYNPAGFLKCLTLTPEAVSYTELVGQ